MKKWEEIEDKLNLALIKRYQKLINTYKENAEKTKNIFKEIIKNLHHKIIPLLIKIKEQFIQISQINPKIIFVVAKNIYQLITFKNFIELLKKPPYQKMGNFIKNNSLNISFLTIFTIGIYKASKEIVHLMPTKKINRNLASIDLENERPNYYLLSKKHLKIENIRIPVSLNENKRIATITADIIIECPNRTTQQFLYNSPHLVQDKINNTIAPQINTFPLTEEGKVILRKKISLELTELLKENHFKEFQIKRVNIIQVTAS